MGEERPGFERAQVLIDVTVQGRNCAGKGRPLGHRRLDNRLFPEIGQRCNRAGWWGQRASDAKADYQTSEAYLSGLGIFFDVCGHAGLIDVACTTPR